MLVLHCYPSDFKQGGRELSELIARYGVKLIDMGHTHYNEISHGGRTIYAATRPTAQIGEGPVGFSVTNYDSGVVSWRFLELGKLPAVMITSPADERLMADDADSDRPARERAERDQDNALEAWPEHGLRGTQLGPNKNGRKW